MPKFSFKAFSKFLIHLVLIFVAGIITTTSYLMIKWTESVAQVGTSNFSMNTYPGDTFSAGAQGAGTQWNNISGDAYITGSLGIGTTTPQSKLAVTGNIETRVNDKYYFAGSGNSNYYMSYNSGTGLNFVQGGVIDLFLNANNHTVGIGTTSTDAKLRVAVTGAIIGIKGTSTDSVGVVGESTNERGVFGSSVNNVGVRGNSTNSIGGLFESTNSRGLHVITGGDDAVGRFDSTQNGAFGSTLMYVTAYKDSCGGCYDFLRMYSDFDGVQDLEFRVRSDGAFWADNTYSGSADYAEYFRSEDTTLDKGELISLDQNHSSQVKRASLGDNTKLFGVVSTKPGIIGIAADDVTDAAEKIEKDPHWKIVGVLGQIPTKVSTENGAIKIGDLITVSSTPGVGMKAQKAGFVVGKALEEFSGPGVGKIMVLVNGEYADPNPSDLMQTVEQLKKEVEELKKTR